MQKDKKENEKQKKEKDDQIYRDAKSTTRMFQMGNPLFCTHTVKESQMRTRQHLRGCKDMNRRNNKERSNKLYSVVKVAVGPGRVRLTKQTKSQNSLRVRAATVVATGSRRPIPHRQSASRTRTGKQRYRFPSSPMPERCWLYS